MIEAAETRWFVVQTQSRTEAKAAYHLKRQGFQTYLPRYLKRRSHARKIERVPAPLFPGYMFVSVDTASQRWRAIRSTIGVLRLVTNGDQPAAMPTAILDAIRLREDDNGFLTVDERPAMKRGEKIRVLAGAFAHAQGLFIGLADPERVAILLEILGRKVRVNLNENLIVAA